MLAALPVGGRLVWDRGFFSFLWCDDCTASARCLVTRMREKTASRTVQELRSSPHERDEIIQVGQDRANPCPPPLRMVSVRWPGGWSRDLTHGRAPGRVGPPGRCVVSAPVAHRGRRRPDETARGFGLRVARIDEGGARAALGHPDCLGGAGHARSADGPGPARTRGADRGSEGGARLLSRSPCRAARRRSRSGGISGCACHTPGYRQAAAHAAPRASGTRGHHVGRSLS
jgi:hypothetical protein